MEIRDDVAASVPHKSGTSAPRDTEHVPGPRVEDSLTGVDVDDRCASPLEEIDCALFIRTQITTRCDRSRRYVADRDALANSWNHERRAEQNQHDTDGPACPA